MKHMHSKYTHFNIDIVDIDTVEGKCEMAARDLLVIL